MQSTNGLVLTSLEMTCSACPSQWDATTQDGHLLYIRYRWGHLSVTDETTETLLFQQQNGDSLDGVMSTEEMLSRTGMTDASVEQSDTVLEE